MSHAAILSAQPAADAFDRMAASYDADFTDSLIGRAQRNVVWAALRCAFHAGDRVLELNCGTGEDALFLADRGVFVLACDASAAMIDVANRRQSLRSSGTRVVFRVLPNEELGRLPASRVFDGVLSNFSGLNCVRDQRQVAAALADLVRPSATALVCLSTRVCAWEIAWCVARANFKKAFRRLPGHTAAHLDGVTVPVWYPTIGQLRRAFSPWFRLRSIRAVGLFVPPSYVEALARKHRRALALLESLDQTVSTWPLLRSIGDHVLLTFERQP
jgi:SAM-dependent methyltransferase